MLHSRGVNCRYLGRLARLAQKEEDLDRNIEEAIPTQQRKNRYKMPLCWLEQLECEMVARASKHVLDLYLLKFGATAATHPSTIVASFLSSLLSVGEENAAESEARMAQNRSREFLAPPVDEELETLTLLNIDGEDSPELPSRTEVWDHIELEIGRRFRYVLTLYNNKSKKESRSLYMPLLRRACQKNGLRVLARTYDLGTKCVSGGGLRGLATTYPISSVDILDICPVVKHSAAQNDGFSPCSFSGASSICLNVLLPDAKQALEVAHVLWNARQFSKALDYAQEASALYQRVIDTPLHSSVFRCLELMSAILLHAQEFDLAASNASRALAVAVQLGGFDCSEALSAHSTLGFIFSSCGDFAGAFRHFQAAIYLMTLCAGPRYAELASMYFKIGGLYAEMGIDSGLGELALKYYQQAEKAKSSDRIFEGLVARNSSMIMAVLGQHKAAVEHERRAYSIYSAVVGEDHQMSRVSAGYLTVSI
jgi:protein TIF31